MNNQLIIYKPKIKLKTIIFGILFTILLGILIFIITTFFTISISSKNKWNETDTEYVNLKVREINFQHK